ncbi:MAG TPA: hypothetical protein PK926_12660, partial [Spirochaetota bacterium]|nr:hypothetical protein [Spirochaetota bacterium]
KCIYVYLYKVLSLFPYEYYTNEEASEVVTALTDLDGTLTLENIAVGDYYVLVFYDSKHSEKSTARKSDPYMLYDSGDTTNYSTESPYTVLDNESTVEITSGATTEISMTYDAAYHTTPAGAAFIDQGGWDLVP